MAQINLNLNQAQQSLKGTLELANKKQKKLEESVDGFFENAKTPKNIGGIGRKIENYFIKYYIENFKDRPLIKPFVSGD